MTSSWTKICVNWRHDAFAEMRSLAHLAIIPQLDQRNIKEISHFPQSLVKEKSTEFVIQHTFFPTCNCKTSHHALHRHTWNKCSSPSVLLRCTGAERVLKTHTKVDLPKGFFIRPFHQLRSVCCNRSLFVRSYLEVIWNSFTRLK